MSIKNLLTSTAIITALALGNTACAKEKLAVKITPTMDKVTVTHNGKKVDAHKKYKVAGWATVNSQAEGRPVWDVTADYIRSNSQLKIKKLNTPKLVNVKGNPGIGK